MTRNTRNIDLYVIIRFYLFVSITVYTYNSARKMALRHIERGRKDAVAKAFTTLPLTLLYILSRDLNDGDVAGLFGGIPTLVKTRSEKERYKFIPNLV